MTAFPLVTAHGTAVTEVDRRLAAGETGVIPPRAPPAGPANRILRLEVTRAWNQTSIQRRGEWAAAAGAPDAPPARLWDRLPGSVQSQLIGHWLDTNRHRFAPARHFTDSAVEAALVYPAFAGDRDVLMGPPETAAAEMFNQAPHPASTSAGQVPGHVRDWFPARARAVSQVSTDAQARDYRPPAQPKPNRDRGR